MDGFSFYSLDIYKGMSMRDISCYRCGYVNKVADHDDSFVCEKCKCVLTKKDMQRDEVHEHVAIEQREFIFGGE